MTPRGRARIAAAPVAAAFLLAAGCGGALGGSRPSAGRIESGAFTPGRPAATNYGPDPSFRCPERGVNGMIADEVASVGAKPEGRLCAVAEALLGWEGENPPDNVLTVLSSDFGLPLAVRKVVITNMETQEESSKGPTGGAAPRDVASRLAEPIKSFASTAVAPRYGVIVERIKKGMSKLVLVMQDQALDLKPVPRKLAAGQTATLSGTLAGNLTNAKVEYTDAVGKLEKAETQGGKSFSTQLKCGDRPGRIIVRVAAEQEGADVVLANFPVGCATDLPVAAAVSAPGGKEATAPVDPAAAEKQLADMINQERKTAGLKPLDVDADLSKVARSLADDRAKGKGTTGEEVTRRMQELDIASPTVLVSEAQAFSIDDAWSRFTNSPQDRANAMNADVTQVGIGVMQGPTVGDRKTVIVAQLFLKQLPPPDADEVKKNLYTSIARRRGDARSGAVAKDPELEKVAQSYASEMAKQKGKVAKERVAEIEAPLYKSFATVNEIGGLKADPLEFAEEPGIVGDAKLVGIGVGIGSSQQFGKNSTYVVILMGKRHAGKTPATTTRQPVKKKQ